MRLATQKETSDCAEAGKSPQLTRSPLGALPMGSRMVPRNLVVKQIKDLTLAEIRAGTNWLLAEPDSLFDPNGPVEEWRIEPARSFTQEDEIVYSGLSVTDAGVVTPVVLIKRVGDLDYGGDYCEWIDGRWRQVGIAPNPLAPPSQEYIANPLPQDSSFETSDRDYRAEHRAGFRRWVSALPSD
jgi:hypothetical protein